MAAKTRSDLDVDGKPSASEHMVTFSLGNSLHNIVWTTSIWVSGPSWNWGKWDME